MALYYSMLVISVINFEFSLFHFDFTQTMSPLQFLKYRLLSITYFESYFLSLLYYTISYNTWYFSGVIYAGIAFDIVFTILVLIFTYEFNPMETIGIDGVKINARNDVLNLYTFHATLLLFIYLFIICIFEILLQHGQLNLDRVWFYSIVNIFWYLLSVRSFAAHFYMIQVMKSKSTTAIRFFKAIVFLYLTSPCLILCLVIRTLHLFLYSLYMIVSRFDKRRYADAVRKWKFLVSTLYFTGENSAIKQFIKARIEPLGIHPYNS